MTLASRQSPAATRARPHLAAALAPLTLAAAAVMCAAPAPAAGRTLPVLHGPHGASRDKVLVIGTDGTRWDLLRRAMRRGEAPNLARLMRRGRGSSTLVPYAPPAQSTIDNGGRPYMRGVRATAFTMSAVGWTTIASGALPSKTGVVGLLNDDPEQAHKHGYADFLERIERARPRLSTFMVANWGNLGLHVDGGPIFSDAIDVKDAVAAPDTIAAYDRTDARDARIAARYLRHGDPDAGFVYFGVVDETAHAVGSATPAYARAIARTDRRIGRLLRAIRNRPSRARERWTVIVTTDHGQRALHHGALLSHGMGSRLERTSFVIAAGPGIGRRRGSRRPGILDIAPTAMRAVGVRVRPAWRLDGRSFALTASRRDHRLRRRCPLRHPRLVCSRTRRLRRSCQPRRAARQRPLIAPPVHLTK